MSPITIPLFPLQTVLVPGFPLALHIFESRYRTMVEECIRTEGPFGVCLIREGREVGDPAIPFEVGTLASLSDVEPLVDGRYNITVLGGRRFRVREVLPPAPYLRASIDLLDVDPPSPLDPGFRDEMRRKAEEYVMLLTASRPIVAGDLPDEAGPLSWLLAFLLQVPAREKQALLEEDDPTARLSRLNILYDRETTVMRQMADAAAGYIVRPLDTGRGDAIVSQN